MGTRTTRNPDRGNRQRENISRPVSSSASSLCARANHEEGRRNARGIQAGRFRADTRLERRRRVQVHNRRRNAAVATLAPHKERGGYLEAACGIRARVVGYLSNGRMVRVHRRAMVHRKVSQPRAHREPSSVAGSLGTSVRACGDAATPTRSAHRVLSTLAPVCVRVERRAGRATVAGVRVRRSESRNATALRGGAS